MSLFLSGFVTFKKRPCGSGGQSILTIYGLLALLLTVVLKTLKQGAGRPSKLSLQRSPKRFIPILDRDFQTRIQSYLWMGKFRKDERIFPITRQAVSANIDRLIKQVGGRAAVQDRMPYLSAQLCGAPASARAAIEVCKPVARSPQCGIDRALHQRTDL
jgi:hypothetical protein